MSELAADGTASPAAAPPAERAPWATPQLIRLDTSATAKAFGTGDGATLSAS
ncbi:MAG: hypothetical protein V7637_4056 [Mycobacteriales bacterium]